MNKKIFVVLIVALVFSFAAGYYFSLFYSWHSYHGYLTFTFDDNRMGQYKHAKGILDEAGFKATFYVTRDNFDADPSFFGAAEVKELYDAGHEIGDHSKTHRDLTSLSETEIIWEIDAEHLRALGIHPRTHAYPYGSYNSTVIRLVSRYYDYARTADVGTRMNLESPPINTYGLNARVVERETSVATVKSWINEAITAEKWLILVFHNIVEAPSAFTEYSISDFQEIVAYAKTRGITVKTLSEVADLLLVGIEKWSAIASERYRMAMRLGGAMGGKEVGEHLMDAGIREDEAVQHILNLLEHCKVGKVTIGETIRIKENCESFLMRSDEPSCFFTTGFLNGFFSAVR